MLEQLNVFAEEDISEAAEALNDVSLNIVTLLSHLRTFFVLQCFSSNVLLLVFPSLCKCNLNGNLMDLNKNGRYSFEVA